MRYFGITFSSLLSLLAMAQQSDQTILLNQMVDQNILTCGFTLDQVDQENVLWKLNDSTASIGFIYRHIGETMNLFGNFLDKPSAVLNTTIGQTDIGQGLDYASSKDLIAKGYAMIRELIQEKSTDWWIEEVDTPFFGKVSRFRVFSHILYHTSHHSGQIALTLSRSTSK